MGTWIRILLEPDKRIRILKSNILIWIMEPRIRTSEPRIWILNRSTLIHIFELSIWIRMLEPDTWIQILEPGTRIQFLESRILILDLSILIRTFELRFRIRVLEPRIRSWNRVPWLLQNRSLRIWFSVPSGSGFTHLIMVHRCNF